jgi:hypothetical protein
MRLIEKMGGVALAMVLGLAGVVRAADIDTKYASLPNLTDEQKAKIAAIEKSADDQITAILTDE